MSICDNDPTPETELEEKIEKENDFLSTRIDSPFLDEKKCCNVSSFIQRGKKKKKFLSAPPRSAYCEKVFSEVGNIYNEKRNCLSSENVENLVFTP